LGVKISCGKSEAKKTFKKRVFLFEKKLFFHYLCTDYFEASHKGLGCNKNLIFIKIIFSINKL